MRPEAAIANWRDWQIKLPCEPVIIAAMGAGLSNQSYLLNAAGRQMVLRINAGESALPGIDREREAIICRAASQAGIAPQLFHAEHSYFVSDFVAAGSITNDAPTVALVDQALGLIHRCHSLEIDVAVLDYASHIQCYWDLIEENGVRVDEPMRRKKPVMLDNLRALLASQGKTVLCHHDPVRANFVGSAQRLFLIDWEYAARGMAVMDYAALALEWGVDDQTVFKGSGIRAEEISQAKALYTYMCQLWALARSSKRPIVKN